MKRIAMVFSSLAISLCAPIQAAQLDQWGTVAATGSYACTNSPCNIIDFIFNLSLDGTGGAGQLGASHELAAGDPNGAARAEVNVLGGLQIPELKAEAYSTAAGGTTALAVGVQAYTYLDGAGTVSLALGLTGAINDSTPAPVLTTDDELALSLLGLDPSAVPDLTRIEVLGALFAPSSGFSLTELTALTPLGALEAFEQYTQLAKVEIIEDATNANIQNLGNLLEISGLNPGDQFYLFTALAASADGAGQYADAFSTVSVEFVVGGDQVALASVPLPAAAWLFSPLAVCLIRRRRAIG